jgi:hypothetical protein
MAPSEASPNDGVAPAEPALEKTAGARSAANRTASSIDLVDHVFTASKLQTA